MEPIVSCAGEFVLQLHLGRVLLGLWSGDANINVIVGLMWKRSLKMSSGVYLYVLAESFASHLRVPY